MRELLENNEVFKTFVISKLLDQYFPFEQIIRLIRNVLSHTTTAEIDIKKDDFIKQRDFLIYEKQPHIELHFSYGKYWKEWKGNKNYGIDININFKKFKE